ncbi:MAG: DUF4290 domain-containing protein [Runella slithyformis]|nr:MAG: DUF4290 domain-containing protein [Runella slithyformis]TAF02381.1 MAG: DUF4290 domain-containing protein [Runella slithyformis]TAF29792.1 MAG: DUF4290 domain-containing protein [Runella slithyformis]TAF48856.1 MAG: DUF4290 domain-containing protein [Runella slithyformis]TAF83439.1 MAG: DUF4290 domain-containing protein [Runella slithyformis]
MKEYGSNVQKLADHLGTMQDPEKRTLYAHILVELMRQIHPNMRDGQDYSQKLWDDLYIMTNFNLDVQSPFPPPSPESVGKKPLQVPYNQNHLKYRQYGENVQLLVEKAAALTDRDEKLAFISYLVRLMRNLYSTWNRDNPEDEVIFAQLADISGGRFKEELEHLKTNGLVESTPRDKGTNIDRNRSQNQMRHFNPNNNNRPQNAGGGNRNNNSNNNNRNNNNNNNKNRNNRPGNGNGGGNLGNNNNGNRRNNGR